MIGTLEDFELPSCSSQWKAIAIDHLANQVVVHDVNTRETVTLAKWVRDNDAYKVTFTQPEYCFTDGALYRRASFTQDVDLVRRCLKIEASLGLAGSEKGKPAAADVSAGEPQLVADEGAKLRGLR